MPSVFSEKRSAVSKADGAAKEGRALWMSSPRSFVGCLIQMLDTEDSSVLSWTADGRAFQIHDRVRLENEVLPKYFKHSKYHSFTRQLNYHGFLAQRPGSKPATYYSENFTRGDKDRVRLIKKRNVGKDSTKKASEGSSQELPRQVSGARCKPGLSRNSSLSSQSTDDSDRSDSPIAMIIEKAEGPPLPPAFGSGRCASLLSGRDTGKPVIEVSHKKMVTLPTVKHLTLLQQQITQSIGAMAESAFFSAPSAVKEPFVPQMDRGISRDEALTAFILGSLANSEAMHGATNGRKPTDIHMQHPFCRINGFSRIPAAAR